MGVVRKLWKWSAITLAFCVILLALTVGLFRLFLPMLPGYHEQLESWASAALGVDVELGTLDARWRLYGPELVFSEGALWASDRSALLLSAESGSVGLSLLDLVRDRRIQPGRIVLRGVVIDVERVDGHWQVLGRSLPAVEAGAAAGAARANLPRGRLTLRDTTLIIEDQSLGAAPTRVTGVELNFERTGDFMRLDGGFDPPGIGSHVDFAAQADGLGEPGQAPRWQLYMEGTRVDLGELTRMLPPPVSRVAAGAGNFMLWASVQNGALEQASINLGFRDLLIVTADQPLRYDQLAGRLLWQNTQAGWVLSGEQLEVGRDGLTWPPSTFRVERGEQAQMSLRADYARLDDLVPLAALLPASEVREAIQTLAPRGELRDASARWQQGQSILQAAARFSELAMQPALGMPGCSGVSGELSATADSGELQLQGSEVVCSYPAMYSRELPALELDAALQWQRSGNDWEIRGADIVLGNGDFRAAGKLEVQVPGATAATDEASSASAQASPATTPASSGLERTLLDMQFDVTQVDMAAASAYLPDRAMHPKVQRWLTDALLSGRVDKGTVSFIGAPSQFPFDEGSGDFRAQLALRDVDLRYNSKFPIARGVDADVEFYNAGLSGEVTRATLLDRPITSAHLDIQDLRKGVLRYRSRTDSGLGDVVAVLRASPFARYVQPVRAASGRGELNLRLTLPLKNVRAAQVHGELDIRDGAIGLNGFREQLQAINGRLRYDPEGLHAEQLDALLFTRPVTVDVAPAALSEPVPGAAASALTATVLSLHGRFDGIDLARGLHPQFSELLAGSSIYRARVRLPSVPGATTSLRVESTLAGTELLLPAPLNKGAEEVKSIAVDCEFTSGQNVSVAVEYDGRDRSLFELQRNDVGGDASQWLLRRGAVSMGGGPPAIVHADGLVIEGSVDRLDVAGWLGQVTRAAQTPGGLQVELDHLALQAAEAELGGQVFEQVGINIETEPGQWVVALNAPRVDGQLFVPRAAEGENAPVVARLQRLWLETGEQPSDDATPTDPRVLPSMVAQVSDFKYRDMRFGQLELEAVAQANGLLISRLATASDAFTVEGGGEWRLHPYGQQSRLDLSLDSTDLLATLSSLAFAESMSAPQASMQASLSWAGPPDLGLTDLMSGDVKVKVTNGQLLNVRPGAGKVFGLLSVAALPRRLSLDFRDVFEQGLGFDEINGDFTLEGGNAYTSNLVLTGATADVGIVGRTGLTDRDYDQTAVVSANVGASLPVAGAIAGGPVVGAALLIFSEILKKPLKELSSTQYRITGSWDEPLIERILPARRSSPTDEPAVPGIDAPAG